MSERFDGVSVNILEDDAGDWIAHFVERPEDALHELAAAWEGVKQTYVDDGEPVSVAPARKEYSGQFNVRIDRRLHRDLAIEAALAGVSLNALVAQKLAQSTHAR